MDIFVVPDEHKTTTSGKRIVKHKTVDGKGLVARIIKKKQNQAKTLKADLGNRYEKI